MKFNRDEFIIFRRIIKNVPFNGLRTSYCIDDLMDDIDNEDEETINKAVLKLLKHGIIHMNCHTTNSWADYKSFEVIPKFNYGAPIYHRIPDGTDLLEILSGA